MARKTRRAPPPATPTRRRATWPLYLVTALLSAALGSGVTYLGLRPALTKPPASTAPSAEEARSQGNEYEDHQQWPQAIAAYQRAIAGGLDNPDVHTDLGVAFFRSGQLQQALEQYAIAQKQDPGHENSLYNEGAVFAELGNVPQSVAIWKEYLRRFPQGSHVAGARQLIAQVQAHRN